MDDRLQAKIRAEIRGKVAFNEPVSRRNTLRIGGPADVWFEPTDIADLSAFVKFCRKNNLNTCLVGNGSNLLVRDGGFRGALIHLTGKAFKTIRREENRLHCGGGVAVSELIQAFKEEGLTGGEFLVGIPGTVGGAVRMNAGAQGGCLADLLVEVEALTPEGEILKKNRSELTFFYRQAPTFQDKIVVSATLQLQAGEKKKIQGLIREYSRKRAAVTPPHPNAGCIFKNPDGASAGLLIDRAGLKGLQQGAAQVSREHGNYFVNLGNATAKDLLSLIEQVKNKIKKENGVELEPEIQIIGED